MADNKHIIELSVFDAGLNTKAQAVNLNTRQSPDLKNVLFDDYGSVVVRPGIKTFNSSIISGDADGSGAVMGLASYKPSTMSAQLIVFAGHTAYVLTGTATSPVSIASSVGVFALGRPVETVVFQEILFAASNGDQPYKFNGNEFTRMGLSAPTQNLTAVCDAAAGNLSGTYKYVFWGVNSYSAEGDYGTASTAVAVTSAKVRVNNIPTAPVSHGINTWKVGRNTANAAGIYWYLTDITNGTTSFTDNVADSSLVDLAPTDNGYPRKFRLITAYANRVWAAVDDYLWFSNLNQPEEFPSENFIRVGRGDGMDISAITPFMGMICISKSDFNGRVSFYALTIGDSVTFADPESWYLKLVSSDSGSECHRAQIQFSNYLMLPNRTGIHLFNGSSVDVAASESNKGMVISEDIANPVSNRFVHGASRTDTVSMKAAAAIKWKERVWFSHPRDTVLDENRNTLVYDYRRVGGKGDKIGAWSEVPTYGASQFVVHEGKLLGGAPRSTSPPTAAMEGGYIHEWDLGNSYTPANDFGGAIPAYFVTAPIHGSDGHEGFTKDFRWVIVSEKGYSSTITVTFYMDGTSLGTATLVHTESYSLTTSLGRDYKIRLPSVASGKRLWIKYAWSTSDVLALTEAQSPTLSRIKICYTLRGLRNA